MKLQKIIDIMEKIAPIESACDWDNVGLMIGLPDNEISKIVISLDFDDNAVEFAINHNADLIITHHPAIFKPLKSITDKRFVSAIENGISVYSAHTNLDAALEGVNYALADCLEMYNCTQNDMMRIGSIEENSFENVINKIKSQLNVHSVRFVGDLNKVVRKVAVLGGSGGDFITEANKLGCDLFVTGECKYDQAQLADRLGINLIAAGHFETENPVVKKLADILSKRLSIDVEVVPENNIFKTI